MQMVDVHSHAHVLEGVQGDWPAAMLVCGTRPDDWPVVSAWCRQRPGRYAAYGVHPWFADAYDAQAHKLLESRLMADPAAGVGEIGLHVVRGQDSLRAQRFCFVEQLRLGCAYQRSVSIHCVHAWGALLACLDQVPCGGARIMIHDFNGSLEIARELQARGIFLSFRIRSAYRRQPALVAGVDAACLLMESDAGGKPGEVLYDPAALCRAIHQMACWRGEDAEWLGALVYANGLRFLGSSDGGLRWGRGWGIDARHESRR